MHKLQAIRLTVTTYFIERHTEIQRYRTLLIIPKDAGMQINSACDYNR